MPGSMENVNRAGKLRVVVVANCSPISTILSILCFFRGLIAGTYKSPAVLHILTESETVSKSARLDVGSAKLGPQGWQYNPVPKV